MNTPNFISLLVKFVQQRPGFNLCNYSSIRDYRSDYYQANKYKKQFFTLLDGAQRTFSFDDLNRALGEELKNNRGRLSFNEESKELRYITGQYFPTEYRRAAFYILSHTVEKLERWQ